MSAIPSAQSCPQVRQVPVAIYTRVSTIDQVGGRFDSCESQEELARQHIARNAPNGYYLSGVFPDPAYSGGSMKRPGMQALMRHIEAGCAQVVLIYKFERVLRSTDEWTSFRAFLKKHNCRLESPVEDLSEKTAMGRFNNNMRANLAEYHRLDTAEKVRVKMRLQAERGIWNCGQVPFGYDYDLKSKVLTPHPIEAPTVRRIYEDAARLVSLTALANTLNADGLRTRTRLFQRRDGRRETVGGKLFRSDKLRKIIRSPIYLGRVHLHGEEFPGHHEAIVTQALWDKANAAVAKPLPARCTLQNRDKHFHLLKGLLFCGHCGRAMIPNASGKLDAEGRPHRYYTCGRAHKDGMIANCPLRHVAAKLLESAIVQFLGATARHPEIVRRAVAITRARTKNDQATVRQQAAGFESSLREVNRKLANCVDSLAAGGAECLGDELRERVAALKDQKHSLLVQQEQASQQLRSFEQGEFDAGRVVRALTHFEDLLPKLQPQEQRDLVWLCLERIELRADQNNEASVEGRPLELRLKLHAARLVEGMEERVVVEQARRTNQPLAKPVVVFETALSLSSARVTIHAPFRAEIGALRPKSAAKKPIIAPHPLRLATMWAKKLAADTTLSHAALARRLRISEPTICRHLQLLRLAAEIRGQWLGLTEVSALRRCSLNKMVSIARLEPEAQRREWLKLPVLPAVTSAQAHALRA